MSPKLQIQLDQDTFYKSAFEEDSSASVLKGKVIFRPSTPVKVLFITLCFRGKLLLNRGFQSTRKTLFKHTWTMHQNVGSTTFNAHQNYTYDFELPLPSDLPETCIADYAKIQYSLKASVETPMFSSNIRTDKPVFIHRNNGPVLSVAYNTHIQNSWKDMVNYEVIIPSHEYILGDSFSVTFKHQPLDTRCKIVSVWAGLNEKTTYYNADGSSVDESCCVKKWLQTAGSETSEGHDVSHLSLTVPKSSKNVHFDSATPYVQVAHSLSTKIDVEIDGKIQQIRSLLPICIVQHTTTPSSSEIVYEQLPTYEIIRFDSPPTYATTKTEMPPAYFQHELSVLTA
ncbi:hypothetical protein K7432_009209 [Basidiobolus ranarum]|uniref:Arrestin C-terminal-like domain-containing protein n=1 Tax=Basidiobolus ranarum TaxID=34480 RepID=A0ABR2WQL7_9FUNG